MGGLIPLVLKPTTSPGNRMSMAPQPPRSPTHSRYSPTLPPTHSPTHIRSQTQPHTHTHARSYSSSHIHSHTRHLSTASEPTNSARPRPVRRMSHQPTPTLPMLPYTSADWRRTIAEIKRQHVSRRYRVCSARCSEILDHIKEPSQVEPTYLISLHFYAATSLELCARPLPPTSPYRRTLLQQARTHFDHAAQLVQTAEASVTARVRAGSAASGSFASPTQSPRALSALSSSTASGSCHSPAGSVSSRAWTADTRMSSPTNSVCSFDELATKTPPPEPETETESTTPAVAVDEHADEEEAEAERKRQKRAKKVSFSLPLQGRDDPDFCLPPPEVIIRPDSPTLGFDDAYFHAGASFKALPAVPRSQPEPEPELTAEPEEIEAEVEAEPEAEAEAEEEVPSLISDTDHDESFVARSVHRYCEDLTVLRAQLASHSADVDRLLAAAQSPTSASPVTSVSAAKPDTHALVETSEDLRALDRKARIERLRQNGWQRKRFDPTRYEELRDAVMAELSA